MKNPSECIVKMFESSGKLNKHFCPVIHRVWFAKYRIYECCNALWTCEECREYYYKQNWFKRLWLDITNGLEKSWDKVQY